MLPGDKELERLARESYAGHASPKPLLEQEVFVWVDLADDSAIGFAGICLAAKAGATAPVQPDALRDINEARTYWVPASTAERLTAVPAGSPGIIRIVAYDGKRGILHWCPVDP
ncbi:MAG TPA: hypothetical protein VF765_34760 [Polyangiaceae bacterium]